jgi:Ribonuclease G/E
MRSQRRIKGVTRVSASASLLPAIERAVEHTAKRFNASKSWVRATAMAHYFGIREHEDYHSGKVTPLRRRRSA